MKEKENVSHCEITTLTENKIITRETEKWNGLTYMRARIRKKKDNNRR